MGFRGELRSMSLSAAEIGAVLAEMRPVVVGGHVRNVVQLDDYGVGIVVAGSEGGARVLILAHPRRSRLHLADEFGDTGTRGPFCRALRRILRGARILAVDQPPHERIVLMRFGAGTASGDPGTWTLACELFGTQPNVLLVEPGGNIRDTLRRPKGKGRAARPGTPYEIPISPGPSPKATRNRFADTRGMGGISRAVQRHYSALERDERLRLAKSELLRPLNRQIKKAANAKGRLLRALEESGTADVWRLRGELLKINLSRVPEGAEEVCVEDVLSEQGGEIAIPLAPHRSAHENMTECFRRYKKLKAASEGARNRLGEVERRLGGLEELRDALESADGTDDVERLTAKARELGIRAPMPEASASAGAEAVRQPPASDVRRFVADDGSEILVGRSNEGNDRLTVRMARGNDWWVHVQGYPGSHVVVRPHKGDALSSEALLDAAALAAHFSKLRNAAKAPVDYTRRKYVQKRKGAKPGEVFYSQNRTVLIAADEVQRRVAMLTDRRTG